MTRENLADRFNQIKKKFKEEGKTLPSSFESLLFLQSEVGELVDVILRLHPESKDKFKRNNIKDKTLKDLSAEVDDVIDMTLISYYQFLNEINKL